MAPPVAYQTDPFGYYYGVVDAPQDPREPQRILVPAGATLTPPPNAPAGQIARLLGNGTWVVVPMPAPDEPVDTPPQDIEQLRATTSMRIADCLDAMFIGGHLSQSEYLDACAGNIPAGPILTAIQNTLTEIEQVLITGRWKRVTIIERNHPLVELIRVVKTMTPEQMDQVFGIVAS